MPLSGNLNVAYNTLVEVTYGDAAHDHYACLQIGSDVLDGLRAQDDYPARNSEQEYAFLRKHGALLHNRDLITGSGQLRDRATGRLLRQTFHDKGRLRNPGMYGRYAIEDFVHPDRPDFYDASPNDSGAPRGWIRPAVPGDYVP